MGRPLYTNNAASALAFGITNTQTTIQVQDGMGALFPNPTGGDYFYITVTSVSVGSSYEIMQCTARAGDVFTVVRGAEGTSPQFFNLGDNVQLRITAAGMNFAVGSGVDASNVAYNEGSTGAVTTTVQAKLQQYISVKDFGATGDGTTDDTTAINNAISASNGAYILFPAGTYKVASPLAITQSGVHFYMNTGASFVTNTPSNVSIQYQQNNLTAVTAGAMKIDNLVENSTYPLVNEGGIWPGKTYAYYGVSKSFDSLVGDGTADAPSTALFAFANNNGSTNDVVAVLGDAVARQNNGSVFGANFIARNVSGTTNTKLVGLEIDVEPSVGTTVSSNGGGLFLNAFSLSNVGPAIQTGGVGGGDWTNGIIIGNVNTNGTALGAQSGLSCKTFINTVNGSFSDAAIRFGNNQPMKWYATGGANDALINYDTVNNLVMNTATAVLTNRTTSSEGDALIGFKDSSANFGALVYSATTQSWNAATTAMKVAANSVTSRSINAAGTINASGADYAEYETKNGTCATVAKGQIIGFDKDGLITDKWDESVSFAVKSTNPNIVGGDSWSKLKDIMPLEEGLTEEQKQKYETNLSEFNAQLEVERQKVDRIAYCGKVPVNVTGAKVGDYIIPEQNGTDIIGVSVTNPTFEQYQIAVGRVKSILADGRAEIVVKSI
jgi:hypothetical protein